ncbi:hypothetical protein DERP_011207 [Dermatophagoides pteronyssinus]|uniref:Uncharacterized protein n=1 Tax=Dermatophagoides pteronyssinus TaxID=6956 RepID=A0ABQ8JCF8_DERPT|nr:hypothetical protein DERP_011207 [Dermatophagoides pteronyssinus]
MSKPSNHQSIINQLLYSPFDLLLILLTESIIQKFYHSFQTDNFIRSILNFLIKLIITIIISLIFYMAIQNLSSFQIKREFIFLIMFLLIMIPTFIMLILMEQFFNNQKLIDGSTRSKNLFIE